MTEQKDAQALLKENNKLKEILWQCLKARQINHVKQIIKEALNNEREKRLEG